MSKQIIIDYQEYLDIQTELDSLRKPAEGEEVTELERQSLTGVLLVRAVQNPDLFRGDPKEIELGAFKAIFVTIQEIGKMPNLRVKFVRS